MLARVRDRFQQYQDEQNALIWDLEGCWFEALDQDQGHVWSVENVQTDSIDACFQKFVLLVEQNAGGWGRIGKVEVWEGSDDHGKGKVNKGSKVNKGGKDTNKRGVYSLPSAACDWQGSALVGLCSVDRAQQCEEQEQKQGQKQGQKQIQQNPFTVENLVHFLTLVFVSLGANLSLVSDGWTAAMHAAHNGYHASLHTMQNVSHVCQVYNQHQHKDTTLLSSQQSELVSIACERDDPLVQQTVLNVCNSIQCAKSDVQSKVLKQACAAGASLCIQWCLDTSVPLKYVPLKCVPLEYITLYISNVSKRDSLLHIIFVRLQDLFFLSFQSGSRVVHRDELVHNNMQKLSEIQSMCCYRLFSQEALMLVNMGVDSNLTCMSDFNISLNMSLNMPLQRPLDYLVMGIYREQALGDDPVYSRIDANDSTLGYVSVGDVQTLPTLTSNIPLSDASDALQLFHTQIRRKSPVAMSHQLCAVRQHDVIGIRLILTSDARVQQHALVPDPMCLLEAVHARSPRMTALLQHFKADPNAECKTEALTEAMRMSHPYEKSPQDASFTSPISHICTNPLATAIRNQHADVVRILLAAKANPLSKIHYCASNVLFQTPLQLAVNAQHEDIIRALITQTFQDTEINTALYDCVCKGDTSTAMTLLSIKANPNIAKEGVSALQVALELPSQATLPTRVESPNVQEAIPGMAKLLIAAKAQVTILPAHLYTPSTQTLQQLQAYQMQITHTTSQ